MSVLDSIVNEKAAERETPAVENEQPNVETENTETTENENAETTISASEAPTENDNTAEQPNAPETLTTETPTSQNPFANEEVAKFNDFVKRTGKGYDEFKALHTPTNEIDSKELLRKYYSEKEGMSEKEIAYEMSKFELAEQTDDDNDFNEDPSPEQLKAQAEVERDLRKAREWREEDVKSLLSESETPNSEPAPEQPTVEQFLQTYEEQQKKSVDEYRQTMYETLPEIKGIELDIQGQKISYTPDEEFTKNLRLVSEDLTVGVNQFFDKGKVIMPKELATEAAWAYKPTRDAMLKFRDEQVEAIVTARLIKERRNISTDNYQNQATTADIDREAAFDSARASRK